MFFNRCKHISDVGEETNNTGNNSGGNLAISNTSSNNLINFPTIVPNLMQGGYTNLLLGLDQHASTSRKLHFDTGANATESEE